MRCTCRHSFVFWDSCTTFILFPANLCTLLPLLPAFPRFKLLFNLLLLLIVYRISLSDVLSSPRLTALSTSPAEGTTLDSSESGSAPYPIHKTFPKVVSYIFPSRALLQITGSWLYTPLYSSVQKIDLQWGTSHKLLITLTSPQYLSMVITGLQNHTPFKLCGLRELDTICVVFRFANWHWNQVMT